MAQHWWRAYRSICGDVAYASRGLALLALLTFAACSPTSSKGQVSVDSGAVDGGKTDVAVSDVAVSDVAVSDVAVSDVAVSDVAVSDVAETDVAESDVAVPDTSAPDVASADTASLDSTSFDGLGTDLATLDSHSQDGASIDGASVDGSVTPTICTGPNPWLWQKSFTKKAGAVVRTAAMADGGMAVSVAGSKNAELIRLSSTGSTAWSTVFAAKNGGQINALSPAGGGSVYVAGQRDTGSKATGWLAKVDAKGLILWEKSVEYAETNNAKTVIEQGPITAMTVVAGAPVTVSSHPGLYTKLNIESTVSWFDKSGAVQQQSLIYLGGNTVATAIAPWESNGVVVAGNGFGKNADGDVFIVTFAEPAKTGGIHSIIGVFSAAGQDRVTGIASFGAGRLAVVGVKTIAGASSLLLTIFDGTGKSVVSVAKSWTGMKLASAAHAVRLSSQGGLVVAAQASAGTLVGALSESWLIGASSAGDVVWQRQLGVAASHDRFSDIAVLPGDKLAVVGVVGDNLRVLRTSPWGHASCGAAGKCAQQSLTTCDDKKPCSAALCVAQSGCSNPTSADGTPCAAGVCKAGVCAP